MTGQVVTNTSSARVVVTRVFGVLVAASAAEHGLGEALQGSRAPAGPFIQSWPDAAFFRIEAGEPALTLVPNLLAAGVLTLLLSTVFVWRAMARSARIPRVDLALVSILLLLVGGGFGPPILGLAVAAAASGPEPRHSRRPERLLAHGFPWIFAAALAAWLTLVPGLPLLDLAFGTGDAALLPVILTAFVLFPLCVLASRAADAVPSKREIFSLLGKEPR
jgi:hypothetical protein